MDSHEIVLVNCASTRHCAEEYRDLCKSESIPVDHLSEQAETARYELT
jgi:hypothetical protein